MALRFNLILYLHFVYRLGHIPIILGLNMIFVSVIWASFGFRCCKKKRNWKTSCKYFLFEKCPWPHIFADLAWYSPRGSCQRCNFCHVAVHI